MKNYKEIFGLTNKTATIWFWLFAVVLLFYFSTVIFLQRIIDINNSYFCLIAVIALLFLIPQIRVDKKIDRPKINSVIILMYVSVLTFILLEMWHLSVFPGSFSPDSYNQYKQVLRGSYVDWHPVLHTWLIFFVPIKIFGNPGAVIVLQNIYFSLSVGYLFYVLYDENTHIIFLVFSWLFIMLNINTYRIMMFPWKDSAMSIFSLVLFTHLIRIYRSAGAWLKKPVNIVMFILFAFLTLMMRHNAPLLVFPIFVILFIFLKSCRKRIFASFASLVVLMLIVKLLIFPAFKVAKPSYRNLEALGLPMTILCNTYVHDKDGLSIDAQQFMNTVSDEESFRKFNVTGNFNSFKWSGTCSYDAIDSNSISCVAGYAWEALNKSPKAAWGAALKLTALVWQISNNNIDWYIGDGINPNELGISRKKDNHFLPDYKYTIEVLSTVIFPMNVFNSIGIINLLLLMITTANVGKAGFGRVFLILAPLCYNFGTMLLLSGPDFRFFHYNFVIIIPLAYIILTQKNDKETSLQQYASLDGNSISNN